MSTGETPQATGREKQIISQCSNLTNAIQVTEELVAKLEAALDSVVSTQQEGKSLEKDEGELCGHAHFLRSKTVDIRRINENLESIIRRLEI